MCWTKHNKSRNYFQFYFWIITQIKNNNSWIGYDVDVRIYGDSQKLFNLASLFYQCMLRFTEDCTVIKWYVCMVLQWVGRWARRASAFGGFPHASPPSSAPPRCSPWCCCAGATPTSTTSCQPLATVTTRLAHDHTPLYKAGNHAFYSCPHCPAFLGKCPAFVKYW